MRLIILFVMMEWCFSLIPKRLPNGTPRTFIPNTKNPREDLKLISQAQASIITKNWINKSYTSLQLTRVRLGVCA